MSKNVTTVRDTLLHLDALEKIERRKVLKDYIFYKGKCINRTLAKGDKMWLGQSWETNDQLDYKPIQDIRNKVKQLMKKQARFMFGVPPDIVIKPDNLADAEQTEALRQYLEDILDVNQFWKTTKKAFLMATIKKRVLARVELNEGQMPVLKYENIEDFSYKVQNNKLIEVTFFAEADSNALYDTVDGSESVDEAKKIYYLYKYSYKPDADGNLLPIVILTTEMYTNGEFSIPYKTTTINTGFSEIPCWLVVNGGELNNAFGESDIEDLIDLQNMYNKKNSEFADALRFQMFGSTVVIDGYEKDVNKFQIRPNALQAVRTDPKAVDKGKQASVAKQEYSMVNSEAIEAYLSRLDKDMRDLLDMPSVTDLSNIPSAKALRYMYIDLIARCEEKWADWEPVFKSILNFIIKASAAMRLPGFDSNWLTLKYTLYFKHNYPLPDDDDLIKQTAMQEVQTGVRSIKSYLKEISKEEDANAEFKEVLAEKALLANAESGANLPELDEDGNIINPDSIFTTSSTTQPITTITSTDNIPGDAE